MQIKPSFVTLLLLISFGSVNAVLFTPALPDIAHFFAISAGHAQKTVTLKSIFRAGVGISMFGVALMFLLMFLHLPILVSLFLLTIIIYFGLCFVLVNASTIAMSHATDKAHGSAVMSFINMALATVVVLSLSVFPIKALLLPTMGLILCIAMLVMSRLLGRA